MAKNKDTEVVRRTTTDDPEVVEGDQANTIVGLADPGSRETVPPADYVNMHVVQDRQLDANLQGLGQQVGGATNGPGSNPANYMIQPPTPRQSPVEPENSADFLNSMVANAIKQLLEGGADSELASVLKKVVNEPAQVVRNTVANPPNNYLKHFRNDVNPNVVIQELDFGTDNPQLNPKRGSHIRFRRGHFFATTDNQVKQLEWMSANPRIDPEDGTRVIGGAPEIYEHQDDDAVIKCPHGCEAYFLAGSNQERAHYRAVHGVTNA